ncbi:MAG TPA: hypothetical protein VMT61_02790 [Candidatus Binataceae bacterium]|nr:hypothetical protein [Candidatus Binataceae bacterium]
MEPIRDIDQPGAVCYRVTPELYLGYARGQFGKPSGVVQAKLNDYRDPGHQAEGLAYLSGAWTVSGESSRAEADGAVLSLRYTASEVNLVMTPPSGAVACVELQLGEGQRPGLDAEQKDDRYIVSVDRPRMYRLVANESVQPGSLKLIGHEPGWAAFAFTFLSCVVA